MGRRISSNRSGNMSLKRNALNATDTKHSSKQAHHSTTRSLGRRHHGLLLHVVRCVPPPCGGPSSLLRPPRALTTAAMALRAEGHTIYMGKDKFENEDLIRYGFLEDIWCGAKMARRARARAVAHAHPADMCRFHVDDLSSAHVYLRLPMVCESLGSRPPELISPGANEGGDMRDMAGQVQARGHLGCVPGRVRAARQGERPVRCHVRTEQG